MKHGADVLQMGIPNQGLRPPPHGLAQAPPGPSLATLRLFSLQTFSLIAHYWTNLLLQAANNSQELLNYRWGRWCCHSPGLPAGSPCKSIFACLPLGETLTFGARTSPSCWLPAPGLAAAGETGRSPEPQHGLCAVPSRSTMLSTPGAAKMRV